jgi:hypothetical protein
MILTLYVGVTKFRHSRNRLIVTLYRDGILYFVYIFRKHPLHIFSLLILLFSTVISATYIIVLATCPVGLLQFHGLRNSNPIYLLA